MDKKNKLSIYFRDIELLNDIKLLAQYEDISLTVLVSKVLSDYAQEHKSDLEFIRKQKEELQKRKDIKDTKDVKDIDAKNDKDTKDTKGH